MARNKPDRRRLTLLGIILAVAFCGLILVVSQREVSAGPNAGTAVLSTQPPAAQAGDAADYQSAYGSIFKMIAALVVVIACIYGGLYLLGRLMGRRGKGASRGRNLEVLESTFVGPKKSVSLLRVGDRSVLVGVTDTGISLLTELNETETKSLLAAQEAPAEEPFGSFLKSAYVKVTQLRMKQKEAIA